MHKYTSDLHIMQAIVTNFYFYEEYTLHISCICCILRKRLKNLCTVKGNTFIK